MNYLKLKQHNQNLRAHQIEAKGKVFDVWNSSDAVMLQMPTGTDKIYLFTSIVDDLISACKEAHKDIPVLIVAHRIELLDRIFAILLRFGKAHGFIQGLREQHFWKRVQVASVISLITEKNYHNTLGQQFDFIIVGEVYHSLAEANTELFKLLPNAKKLGVMATQWRLNYELFLQRENKKAIIIDNARLYNFFGLPDANCKWQYHFKGRDNMDHISTKRHENMFVMESDYVFDEGKFEEDNKEMLVVRGTFAQEVFSYESTESQTPSPLLTHEIPLCNYFFLRGNSESFKIYPFVKKKGKATEAVAGCIYEYNSRKRPIILKYKRAENKKLVESDIKQQIIIGFSALLLNIDMNSLFSLYTLCQCSKRDKKGTAKLFEILEMISKMEV